MVTRVVITHLNRGKVNQIDQWPLDSLSEIALGRDQGSTIAFDLQRDDMVSRRHAVIRIERDPPTCKIADLGSSNGTSVNGLRITQETELLPGDVVELGSNGPRFSFDLQPRPADLAGRIAWQGASGLLRTAPAGDGREEAVVDDRRDPQFPAGRPDGVKCRFCTRNA